MPDTTNYAGEDTLKNVEEQQLYHSDDQPMLPRWCQNIAGIIVIMLMAVFFYWMGGFLINYGREKEREQQLIDYQRGYNDGINDCITK